MLSLPPVLVTSVAFPDRDSLRFLDTSIEFLFFDKAWLQIWSVSLLLCISFSLPVAKSGSILDGVILLLLLRFEESDLVGLLPRRVLVP